MKNPTGVGIMGAGCAPKYSYLASRPVSDLIIVVTDSLLGKLKFSCESETRIECYNQLGVSL